MPPPPARTEPPRDVTTLARGLIAHLRTLHSERDIVGMQRFGIVSSAEQLGVSVTKLREIARPYRRHHALAVALWEVPIHEARILATLVADPKKITRAEAERWVRRCDNWAQTDSLAFVLDRTAFAVDKAHAWSAKRAEFVKRTGYAMMAGMAVHRKELPDEVLLAFLPAIRRGATDERNFVKKAVNWALRQIGKRNLRLRRAAIAEAKHLLQLDSKAARWIARDALRELLAR